MEDQKFDKRLIERRIRSGIVARDEFDKHMAAIPDTADNVEIVEATIEAVKAERETASTGD
jgi:hypothetical protein